MTHSLCDVIRLSSWSQNIATAPLAVTYSRPAKSMMTWVGCYIPRWYARERSPISVITGLDVE